VADQPVRHCPDLSSETGDLITVAKATNAVTNLGVSTLGWGFGGATVGAFNGFELCVICQGGPKASATPSEGIMGPASADGKHDNAKGSIAGNKAHNPFVSETATFAIEAETGSAGNQAPRNSAHGLVCDLL